MLVALRHRELPRREPVSFWPLVASAALLFVAVAVLAAAAAVAADHTDDPRDESAEAGFARDMAVHHEQAVQMAQLVATRTRDEDIRLLALDITLTQQAQLGQMRGWLDAWGLRPTGAAPPLAWTAHGNHDGMEAVEATDGMAGMAGADELDALRGARGREADRRFLELMVPHHRAGVAMAESAVAVTDRPEVERLANAIADSQRSEIRLMEELLAERSSP